MLNANIIYAFGPMRRQDLLDVIDMPVGVFNALSSRGLLPFPGDARRAGWGSYTADDAFRLSLFVELTRQGRTQADAASLIREGYDDLLAYVARTDTVAATWFGAFWTRLESDDVATVSRWPLVVSAGSTDAEIGHTLTVIGQSIDAVDAVTLVNANRALERVARRAKRVGLTNSRFDELIELFVVTL